MSQENLNNLLDNFRGEILQNLLFFQVFILKVKGHIRKQEEEKFDLTPRKLQ